MAPRARTTSFWEPASRARARMESLSSLPSPVAVSRYLTVEAPAGVAPTTNAPPLTDAARRTANVAPANRATALTRAKTFPGAVPRSAIVLPANHAPATSAQR